MRHTIHYIGPDMKYRCLLIGDSWHLQAKSFAFLWVTIYAGDTIEECEDWLAQNR